MRRTIHSHLSQRLQHDLLLRVFRSDKEDPLTVSQRMFDDRIKRRRCLADAGRSGNKQVTAFFERMLDGLHHLVLMRTRFAVRKPEFGRLRAPLILTALLFLRLRDQGPDAFGNQSFAVVERPANLDFLRRSVGGIDEDQAGRSTASFLLRAYSDTEKTIQPQLFHIMRIGICIQRREDKRRRDHRFDFFDHERPAIDRRMHTVDAPLDRDLEVVHAGRIPDEDFAGITFMEIGLRLLPVHVRLAAQRHARPHAQARHATVVGKRLRQQVAHAQRDSLLGQFNFDSHAKDRIQ